MDAFEIKPLDKERSWANRLLEEHWGSTKIVTRGRVRDASVLPGFVAVRGEGPAGLVTYNIEGGECEIVSLDSLIEGIGIGSALIEAVRKVAASEGCSRLWLITTNDNIHALRFYQKRGFLLAALHRNALEQARLLKPQIPLIGVDGIPIRDEIELEMPLSKLPA